MNVKFLKLHHDAIIPSKAYENDFCYDCVATSMVDMGDGRIQYGLGFAIELDPGLNDHRVMGVSLRPRGSIHKTGLILSNGFGTVDYGYRGELMATFYKVLPHLEPYDIGDRVCQISIEYTDPMEFGSAHALEPSHRGDGKYGSSGK